MSGLPGLLNSLLSPGLFFNVFFCRRLIFFKIIKIIFFQNQLQEYHQCQTVWIQIRPDMWSGLIWIQTICKGYQQTTLGGKELKRNSEKYNRSYGPCLRLSTTLTYTHMVGEQCFTNTISSLFVIKSDISTHSIQKETNTMSSLFII